MHIATWLKACALAALLLTGGCNAARSGEPAQQALPPAPGIAQLAAGLPSLASLRAASYTPGDLAKLGGAFDTGSEQQVSVLPTESASFDPDFDGTGAHDAPAWAVYQFDLSGYAGAAQLELAFAYGGAFSDVWLAVADWGAEHWTFRQIANNFTADFDAVQFAPLLEPGTGRFACAVIILGQDGWVLDEVRVLDGANYPNQDCPLGVNLEGMSDWMDSFVWVDAFKTARTWISQPSDGSVWDDGRAIPVDANGWPTSLAADQYAGNVLITGQGENYPAGEYICLYDGEGVIDFRLDGHVVSQEPGRIVVQISPSADGLTQLLIKQTNPANPVRNIRVVLPGFEESYAAQVFTPEFLASCEPFKVLRFMDWGDTNSSSVTTWASRAGPDYFTQASNRGASVEHMVDLSNRLGADPWFCMGHLMDDDAVRQYATYVRDNLDPSLRVYVEHSNEVWNGQFPQAQYARQQGLALGLSADPFQAQLFYHSRRSVQIFEIWTEVFDGNARLVRVLGSQAVNPWVSEQVASFEDAYAHADAIGIAPYFGFTVPEADAAAVKAGGIPGIVAQWEINIAGQREDYLDAQQATAAGYGLKLVSYEGGQHLVGLGNAVNDDELTALLTSSNRTPELRGLYKDYLDTWHAASEGGIMLAFSHIGGYSKWGSWGLRESQSQDPATAPKWQGCLDFLAEFE